MKSGQGFVLVFSIDSLASLIDLNEIHDEILRIKNDKHVPLVLAGNKIDLKANREVARNRGVNVGKSWGDAPYYETSARTKTFVDEVFVDLCKQMILKDQMDAQKREIESSKRKTKQQKGQSEKSCNIL